MTHRERQQLKQSNLRKRVMEVLHIDEAYYYNLQFENAYGYFETNERYKDFEDSKDLAACKLFWAWWKNQYSISDDRFLAQMEIDNSLYSKPSAALLRAYNQIQINKKVFPSHHIYDIMKKEIESQKKAPETPQHVKS